MQKKIYIITEANGNSRSPKIEYENTSRHSNSHEIHISKIKGILLHESF